jgi:hypothetical protein
LKDFCPRRTFVWRRGIAWALIPVEAKQAANDRWLEFPRRAEITTVTRGAAGACTRIVLNANARHTRLSSGRNFLS